ncbi:uncharacterized protein LOC108734988 [Agrilus planipennis]|uniref:Uncharacterized protein LOC108734988 n=1 Tax=Agrilus planipennis TaxID=224129 RepID=A0A1W4WQF9_AGRPL|nr:uncharacterized protein LOC108734988 [Agrilus planipennis]
MWAVLAAAIWVCALANPLQPLHLERGSYRHPQEFAAWRKRDSTAGGQQQQQQQQDQQVSIGQTGLPGAEQLMLRSPRGGRQYDVPQVECPPAADGMDRFACPTPDRQGRYHCIDDHVLCNGFIDCPTGEDEDRQACMYYKTIKVHLDVLADALLRWAQGR